MAGKTSQNEHGPREGTRAQLADDFFAALREGDDNAAQNVVVRAIADGMDGPAIYLGVFQPALERCGASWEAGEVGISEEHLATDITRWMMDALLGDFKPQKARASKRSIVAGCVQGEEHDLGLLMVVRFLRRDGWYVASLGADVPVEEYARMAVRRNPSVCLISAATAERFDAVRLTIAALRAGGIQAPVLVGGAAFRRDSSLAETVGAAATAADAAAAVELVSQTLGE